MGWVCEGIVVLRLWTGMRGWGTMCLPFLFPCWSLWMLLLEVRMDDRRRSSQVSVVVVACDNERDNEMGRVDGTVFCCCR